MGTACAVLLANQPRTRVTLWTHRPEAAAEMQATRQNSRLLPEIELPPALHVTADPACLRSAALLVLAIPSKFLHEALPRLREFVPPQAAVVSTIKGIEPNKFQRPSQIILEAWGDRPVAVLGGPCHAEEFARRLPTSVVVASRDQSLAQRIQQLFSTDRFRVYTNTDLTGVELAGALKNVIGIAAGICDGVGYGDNAKSALLTRAIVEMTRFGVAFGTDPATFWGLAGMGDLITTCVSPYGRNRRVGERLGRGETLAQIQADMQAVAEGVTTAASVDALARQHEIDMPITREVTAVLFEGKRPDDATDALMLRPAKPERMGRGTPL